MNMSASTSTEISQTLLEYLYEESPDVEGEYILLDKVAYNKRLNKLHSELLKECAERKSCWGVKYNINREENLTNNVHLYVYYILFFCFCPHFLFCFYKIHVIRPLDHT